MSEILTTLRDDVKPTLERVNLPPSPYRACSLVGVQPTGIALSAVRYGETIPEDIWANLPPAERDEAEIAGVARASSFVAGRLALRHALSVYGLSRVPGIGVDFSSGAPMLPRGFVGSVAHTQDLAVAIAAHDTGEMLGVDVERIDATRRFLALRVLGTEEAQSCARMPSLQRNAEVILRFSVKEAAFKAASALLGEHLEYEDLQIAGAYSKRCGVQRVLVRTSGSFADATLRCTVAVVESFVFSTCKAAPKNHQA
jgi:4'-phosphopantetheinyl transferase EntD